MKPTYWIAALIVIAVPVLLLQPWQSSAHIVFDVSSLMISGTLGVVIGTICFRRVGSRTLRIARAALIGAVLGGVVGLITAKTGNTMFCGVLYLWPTYMLFGAVHTGLVSFIFGAGFMQR